MSAEEKKEQAALETPAASVSQEQFDSLKAQLAEQNKKLEALLKTPDVPEAKVAPEIPKETFKYKGKEYKFTHPQFHIPGIGKRTAKEALADKATQEALVKMNAGVIKEVF